MANVALGPVYAVIILVSIAANLLTVPVWLHILLLTVPIIYIGSIQSLLVEDHEHMQSKDAAMFPLYGSAVLFSLFLLLKFLPKDWVNFVIRIYFVIFGEFAINATLAQMLYPYLSKDWETEFLKLRIPKLLLWLFSDSKKESKPDTNDSQGKTNSKDEDSSVSITKLEILLHFVTIPAVVTYFITNHWLLNNLIGISFSIQAIQMINYSSFWNGAILLCGLFVYDIFWVFGTVVMVEVATSIDGPIKLLFPRPGDRPSLLGLGDIVIPGAFIALMLRFDRSLSKSKDLIVQSRPYFNVCLLFYTIGICTTLGVMYLYEHAQPALLYLVPACLLSVMGISFARGQFSYLWKYDESSQESISGNKVE